MLAPKIRGGEIKFDSGTTTVPTRVKEAASKLDVNGISDVVIVPASQNNWWLLYRESNQEGRKRI